MIYLFRRKPKPSRRSLIWQFYTPSTESVRKYEEENRNRARVAEYLRKAYNQTRTHYER